MYDRICFPYKDDNEKVPEVVEVVKRIYDRMLDSISRDIFVNRLIFSMTGNHAYLRNILLQTVGGKELNQVLNKKEKFIYIYGAGIRGKRLIELFPDYKWGGLVDKNTKLEKYRNIKIMNLEEFLKRYQPGTAIIISNMMGTDEIMKDLGKRGVGYEDIYVLNSFEKENIKDIYFLQQCVNYSVVKEKSFVDIGCYDGKDSIKYLKWSGRNDVPIFAFEPDKNNYKLCKEALDAYSNIQLFNVGLSDIEEEVGIMGEGEMSYLGADVDEKIRTCVLDSMLQSQRIGYIKMDVEGYEKKVLRGARNIIASQHPTLAVSIYHKRADIWEIPKQLLEFNENYHFYMRHYSITNGDTVLYALDKKGVNVSEKNSDFWCR